MKITKTKSTVMIWLFPGLLFLGSVFGQNDDFTIKANPQHVQLGGTSSLTLSCDPTQAGITSVFQMAIGRRDPDGMETEIARINTATSSPSRTDTSFGSRLTTSGNLAPNHQELKIELSPPSCDDAGTYYCKTVYLNSMGSVGQSETEVTVSVDTAPNGLNLTVEPDQKVYEVGANITFICSGNLGHNANELEPWNNWAWEWRNDSLSDWSTPIGDFQYLTPVQLDNCSYFAETTFSLIMTEELDQQQVRCTLAGPISKTTIIRLKPKPKPVTLQCDESSTLAAVSQGKTVSNGSAGLCSNGRHEMSESVPMEFCNAPDTSLWQAGPAVMDVCDSLPLQTPIATFQFGMYVNNNAGLSGIFMGCSDNGFTMAAQICGHAVDLYHLDPSTISLSAVEDPSKYHVIYIKQKKTPNKPILIG